MKVRNVLISSLFPRSRSGMLRLCSFVLFVSAFPALAQVNGAIFTTTSSGTTVNGNLYDAKTSVYLNGGPQNSKDPGIQPDGTYYFQVTDPSGAVLLSADDITCRQVVVSNGRVTSVPSALPAKCTSGFHPLGTNNPANGETPVQLCPKTSSPRTDNLNAGSNFDASNWCDTTPNPGGEYKAWLTPISSYNSCSKSSSNIRYGFCDSDSKTDNFKVKTSNSAYLTVCKFNDLDGDGVQDSTEPLIPGWPITATGVDTSSGPIGTVNTQTDATGCVSFSVSDFTTANGQVTITEGSLTGSWRETAPAVGTYAVPDGVVPADSGTVTVTVSNSGAPPNTQSLKVAAGDHLTLTNFGNTCLDSSCGGNAIELTVTEDANPSLTRTYTWGITKAVDVSTVYSVGTAASAPANYTVTVTHDNGSDSGWQATGTIKVTNPSWVDLGGVDVADSVNNGGTCTVTNGSAITIPAKSEVDVPYTCVYSSLPANGTNTATATWNSGYTTPGKAAGTASLTFGSPAVKVTDGSVTVTDKLDNGAPATLGTAAYTGSSPITYTYYRTFTDPAGTCTSHANTATFTTNTTHATSSAATSVQDCHVNPPSATCVVINATQNVAITPVTMLASGGVAGPYTFSATGLPAGLTIASNGVISGTPTVSGTFNYTVTVTDKNGNKGTVNCSVTVAAPPVSATCLAISAVKSVAITPATMVASGGAGGPYTFTATGLPAGLTMASNGTISGAPTVSGTFNYTVTVTDKNGNKGTVNCSVTVDPQRGNVTSEINCWNPAFAYGYDYSCDANNDSGTFQGYMTYSYDGGSPVTVQMNAAGHALFSIHLPAVGNHTLLVTYPTQGNWNGYTLPLQTFTVTPAQTQLSTIPSTYYAPAGTVITFAVSLTSPSAGAPKSIGTVSFYDGSTLLGNVAVDGNGMASISTGALTVGYHTLNVKYSGGGNFAAASDAKSIQIGSSTLSWATPAAITYGTPLSAAQLDATNVIAGTYAYSPAAGTILAPGQQSLTVTFTPADITHYVVQTATVTLTINKAPQTISFTTPSSGKVNAQITLNGTGGGSGNPVTYTVAGPATLNGNTLTLTASGTVTVTANQAGNNNYLAANPLPQTIIVSSSAGNAKVTLTAASTTLKYPASENLVACVTLPNNAIPSGTIVLYDDGTPLTTAAASGCVYWWATPSLQVGTHTLTAVYNDTNNKNVTSGPFTVTVSRGDVTSEVNCWNANFAYGYDYQCDANNDSGTFQGYMTYSYDGGAPGTVQMNAAGHALFSIHLPVVGNHTVVITYPQQGNWNSNTLPSQNFTVTPAQTQVSIIPSASYARAGTAITLSVSLTSPSAGSPNGIGTVSFYDGSTLLAKGSVDANGKTSFSTSALAVGFHAITANYSGGGYFGSASGSISIQISN